MRPKHRAETTPFGRTSIPLTDHELIEAVLALTVGEEAYSRQFKIRGRMVRLQNRGVDAGMGRFGGGWQRQLGIQLGRNSLEGTIIVNLWKGSIRIDPKE